MCELIQLYWVSTKLPGKEATKATFSSLRVSLFYILTYNTILIFYCMPKSTSACMGKAKLYLQITEWYHFDTYQPVVDAKTLYENFLMFDTHYKSKHT